MAISSSPLCLVTLRWTQNLEKISLKWKIFRQFTSIVLTINSYSFFGNDCCNFIHISLAPQWLLWEQCCTLARPTCILNLPIKICSCGSHLPHTRRFTRPHPSLHCYGVPYFPSKFLAFNWFPTFPPCLFTSLPPTHPLSFQSRRLGYANENCRGIMEFERCWYIR